MNAICNKSDSRGAGKLLLSESPKKFAAIELAVRAGFEGRQTLCSCRGLAIERNDKCIHAIALFPHPPIGIYQRGD
jgi:hypothetical protein